MVLGVLGVAGFQVTPVDAVQAIGYLLLAAMSVLAVFYGIRIHRPALRGAWYVLAAGQVLWLAGDVLYVWYEDVLHVDPFPSVADVPYLGAYPVLALGLVLLITGRGTQRDVGALLDSATVTAGLALLSWVVLLQPTLEASEQSVLSAVVAAAYPAGDVVLVGALLWVLTSARERPVPTLRLLLGALALQVVADTAYLAFSLFGTGESDRIDFLWLLSFVLWGAAALHPSIAVVSRAPQPPLQQRPFHSRRLLAMILATLVAPGTLAVQDLLGLRVDVLPVVIASAVMFPLVVVRMKIALDQVRAANTKLEKLREELAFRASHDSLTDLPNRASALGLVHAALNRAQRGGNLAAVLFVDLDGFKAVNDSYGHRAGDEVLRVVADRLRHDLRAGDTAARLGGDEFLVLLESVESEAAAVAVAQRLVERIARPVPLGVGGHARVGASIGVAFSADGTDADTLLHEADLAVYRAKAQGRSCVEVYSAVVSAELGGRAELEQAIRGALDRDELVLHFQPVFAVRSGRLDGYEALLRWRHPELGLLAPDHFIPVAESSDLICDVDAWVLDKALAQLAFWNQLTGTRRLMMGVNISGRHVNSARICDDVAAALRVHDVEPAQLVLELTETVLVEGHLALENIRELRGLGVVLALDDFGTGYSTLAQLSRLPVDVVKIDRSYLTSEPATRQLLRLMVQSAHAFGLPVVAEGVESAEDLEVLLELRVECAQGFHLGAPVPASAVVPTVVTAPAPVEDAPLVAPQPTG